MQRKNRRRLSHLPVALKYAMALTLTSGFFSFLMILMMAWFIQRNYNLFLGDELGLSSQVVELVRREQQLLESSLLILFCLSLTGVFFSSFVIIRRLAGPMVAVQRQLYHFTRGDWSRDLKLRRQDEFSEVASLVNELRKQRLGLIPDSTSQPSSGSAK